MYTVGVDLGGTQIRAGLFDQTGNIIKRVETLTYAQEGPDAVIRRIKESIYEVCSGQVGSIEKEIIGLGVGSPGPLNPFTGVVLFTPNLPGWNNVPLRDILHSEFHIPVYLNNDANSAVLGEYFFGKGKGISNLVYITISTGVGGGVMVHDQLVMGEHGSAAEIGHMVLNPDGPVCGCGNHGCFEAFCSGTGILNRTKNRLEQSHHAGSKLVDTDSLSTKDIFDMAREEDPLAVEIVEETRRYLGVGLVNIIHLYNPHMIVIGGGVSKVGDFLLQPAIEYVHTHAMKEMAKDVEFTLTSLGGDVGLVGAGALVQYYSGGER